MKSKNQTDIAIVGGGIVGLAHAYMAARKGFNVVVFDRKLQCEGASVRNFGLIWPVGQPEETLDRAIRSRHHWQMIAQKADLWVKENGSLHLAFQSDELDVLEEFMEQSVWPESGCAFLPAEKAVAKNSLIKKEGLLAALWSPHELTVDPRETLKNLPLWLKDKYDVRFEYGQMIKEISYPQLITAQNEIWEAENIFVCGGADFETLFPEVYNQSGMTKCKLQMMRAVSPVGEQQFGPTLCAGLTLGHYASFSDCPSLEKLKMRFDRENPEFSENGIHVLLALNGKGELVIGDSHQYGLSPEPFDSEEINQLILRYLRSFTHLDNLKILERWHGIYPKLPGKTEFMAEPEKGVHIVNGLGGAGMTLSFGLAEENINQL